MLKQLSVFIENKSGRLAEITGYLADAGINIHALSIADTTDFGILRLIVNDADKAKAELKSRGLTVKTSKVVAVALDHKPGSLYDVLCELEKAGAAIEYMYAFTGRAEGAGAMVVLRLANQDEILEKLQDRNINLIGDEVIAKL